MSGVVVAAAGECEAEDAVPMEPFTTSGRSGTGGLASLATSEFVESGRAFTLVYV